MKHENSVAIQWLGFGTFTASSPGSTPGRGTMIPQTVRCATPPQKKNDERENFDQISNKPISNLK